jgi:Tat protein secretion system quality control protein TatD with DNase activity
MSTNQCTAELNKLIDEHAHLQVMIEADRAWWQEVREIGIPRFWEMASRLANLRSQLSEHFSHEESAEQNAVKMALGVTSPDEIAAMADEHSDFLQRLDRIISKANASGGYECWGEIGLEFGELIHAIDEHESSEFRLLKNALGEVTGTIAR